MNALEKLVEVRRITEWRDGCVYKTVHVEFRWVPMDCEYYKPGAFGEMFCALSTGKVTALNHNVIRRMQP